MITVAVRDIAGIVSPVWGNLLVYVLSLKNFPGNEPTTEFLVRFLFYPGKLLSWSVFTGPTGRSSRKISGKIDM